jgi:hypothetical protein
LNNFVIAQAGYSCGWVIRIFPPRESTEYPSPGHQAILHQDRFALRDIGRSPIALVERNKFSSNRVVRAKPDDGMIHMYPSILPRRMGDARLTLQKIHHDPFTGYPAFPHLIRIAGHWT